MPVSILNIIIAAFALLGALDRLTGGHLGLAEEFEKGFHLFGGLALSMIGMIVMVPLLADVMRPGLEWLHGMTGVEPSVITASLIANDMGGAALSVQVAQDARLGMFNALVVSSMMGGTIAFTIPVSLSTVARGQHRELLLGLLCGIATIPVGCAGAGLLLGLPLGSLAANLLPLILFSALIALGLLYCPDVCARIFGAVGAVIKGIITVGLALSILRYLTGVELIKGLTTLEDAAAVSLSCSIVLTGVLPLMALLSRLLKEPMQALGRRLRVNEASVLGLAATLASSITTFSQMEKMDPKGVLLNAAFAISAAFVFADHLAFTMSFEPGHVGAVVFGKLLAGAAALAAACALHGRLSRRQTAE